MGVVGWMGGGLRGGGNGCWNGMLEVFLWWLVVLFDLIDGVRMYVGWLDGEGYGERGRC